MWEVVILLFAIYFGYRMLLIKPGRTPQPQNTRGNVRERPVNESELNTLVQMFPQYRPSDLRQQLAMRGLSETIEGLLTGKIKLSIAPPASSSTSTTSKAERSVEARKKAPVQFKERERLINPDELKRGWLADAGSRRELFELKRDFLFQQSRM